MHLYSIYIQYANTTQLGFLFDIPIGRMDCSMHAARCIYYRPGKGQPEHRQDLYVVLLRGCVAVVVTGLGIAVILIQDAKLSSASKKSLLNKE